LTLGDENQCSVLSDFSAGSIEIPFPPVKSPPVNVEEGIKEVHHFAPRPEIPRYTSVEHPNSFAMKAVKLDDRSHFSQEMVEELKRKSRW
jgi:hypothetical protein